MVRSTECEVTFLKVTFAVTARDWNVAALRRIVIPGELAGLKIRGGIVRADGVAALRASGAPGPRSRAVPTGVAREGRAIRRNRDEVAVGAVADELPGIVGPVPDVLIRACAAKAVEQGPHGLAGRLGADGDRF